MSKKGLRHSRYWKLILLLICVMAVLALAHSYALAFHERSFIEPVSHSVMIFAVTGSNSQINAYQIDTNDETCCHEVYA